MSDDREDIRQREIVAWTEILNVSLEKVALAADHLSHAIEKEMDRREAWREFLAEHPELCKDEGPPTSR